MEHARGRKEGAPLEGAAALPALPPPTLAPPALPADSAMADAKLAAIVASGDDRRERSTSHEWRAAKGLLLEAQYKAFLTESFGASDGAALQAAAAHMTGPSLAQASKATVIAHFVTGLFSSPKLSPELRVTVAEVFLAKMAASQSRASFDSQVHGRAPQAARHARGRPQLRAQG